MNIRLEQTKWEITDDVEWSRAWVGLSSGDVYRGSLPWGHYLAAWYPNTSEPMVMIVTMIDECIKPILSIGVRCLPERLQSLHAVEPEDVPWVTDGWSIFGPMVRLNEFDANLKAQEALSLARVIVFLDDSLRKYICRPRLRLTRINSRTR